MANFLSRSHEYLPVLCFHSLNFEKFHTALGCKEDVHAEKYPIAVAAIHRRRKTIPHHQAIASTSSLAEITQELAKTHPIKHEPSLIAPKIHIDQTSPFRKQLHRRYHPPTKSNDPSPSGYCLYFSSLGNRSRTCEDTSNQTRSFPHTSQNTHRSNIAILEAIAALLPSTDIVKRSLTIRLLPPLQFLQKSLENSQRHIQSSTSLPSHLPKYKLIKHCHFGSDCGAAAIHPQHQTIPRH